MKRVFVQLLFALLTFTADAETREVKIGYITDLTGPAAFFGKYSSAGAKFAEAEIKKDGGTLSVTIEEHGLKAPRAVTAAQKLLRDDKVDAIISDFSSTTLALAPTLRGVPALLVSVAAATSHLKTNSYIYKSFTDYERGCAEVTNYWKKRGIRKVAVLKAMVEFGELCLSGARKNFPEVAVEEFELGSDVSAQVLRLKGQGTEAILSPAFEGDNINLLKSLQNLAWRPQLGFGAVDGFSDQVLKQFPGAIKNAVGFGLPSVSKDFEIKITEKFPDITTTGVEAAAIAYLHVKQLFNSISRCNAGEAECYAKNLAQSPADEILGFEGWDDRIAKFGFALYKHENGQLVSVQ